MSHLPSGLPHPTLSQFLESFNRKREKHTWGGGVWDDESKSKFVAGQGMNQMIG